MFNYLHVDVFTKQVMAGNGLAVVFDNKRTLSTIQMQQITREFKQFETIFIQKQTPSQYKGFVFTIEEELEFAGHPILGATAGIHECYFKDINQIQIEIILKKKVVTTTSERIKSHYYVEMNQGNPEYLGQIPAPDYEQVLHQLNLQVSDVYPELPLEIISTGLPYLLIPLQSGLGNAKITSSVFENLLNSYGAKFVYLFDVKSLECRTWDNLGLVEDVATGSAAGPLCAYLVKHGLKSPNSIINIHQGRFINRSSIIKTKYLTPSKHSSEILIAGDVSLFASGSLFLNMTTS